MLQFLSIMFRNAVLYYSSDLELKTLLQLYLRIINFIGGFILREATGLPWIIAYESCTTLKFCLHFKNFILLNNLQEFERVHHHC